MMVASSFLCIVLILSITYCSLTYADSWQVLFRCSKKNTALISTSANGNALIAICGDGSIYFSLNAGLSWTLAQTLPLNGPSLKSTCLASSSTGQIAITSTEYGLFTSTDFGANWQSISSAQEYYFTSLTASANGSVWFATSTLNMILKSTDQGVTWSILSTSPSISKQTQFSGISCNAACSIIYASTLNGKIYRSYDGGRHWTLETEEGKPDLTADHGIVTISDF